MKAALQRVLLVEDEPDIPTIVRTSLELVGGFQVRACASGPEALSAIEEFSPQLALLDVMMPDMDGPALLAALRARPKTAALPVAFLTAKTGAAETQRLRSLGAVEVLNKPFDPMTLPLQVKEIWERTQAD